MLHSLTLMNLCSKIESAIGDSGKLYALQRWSGMKMLKYLVIRAVPVDFPKSRNKYQHQISFRPTL